MAKKSRSASRSRRRPAPPARRPARPSNRGPAPARGPRRTGGWQADPRIIFGGVAAALVLLLWMGRVLRATGSVVFWLAVVAAVVGVADAVRQLASDRPRQGRTQLARLAVVVTLAFLVPIAFDPRTHDVFNVTKFSLLCVGAVALAALWCVDWAGDGASPRWRNGLHWPVLAFVGWALVATFFSASPRASFVGNYASNDGWFALAAFAVVAFAAADALVGRRTERIVGVLVGAGGGIVVLYGLIQLHDRLVTTGGRWDWVNWGDALFKNSAIWSTFGNPNHLSGFLALLVPLAVVLLLVVRSTVARVGITLLTVAALVEIVQTTTRGAWVAVVVSLLVLALLLARDALRRPAVVLGVVGAVVVVAGVSFVGLRDTVGLRAKLDDMFETGTGSSVSQRTELWQTAVAMAADRPLVGGGPDSYVWLFPQHQSDEFVEAFGPDQIANGAHNVFMQVLATTGVPGLLAFLAVLVFAALRAVGALRRLRVRERDGPDGTARRERLMLCGVVAALVAYLVQASFNVQQIGLSFTFWLLLGVLAAATLGAGVPVSWRPSVLVADPDDGSTAPSGLQADVPRRGRTAGPDGRTVAVAIVAGIAGIVLAWISIGPFRADLLYGRVLRGEDLRTSGGQATLDAILDTVVKHSHEASDAAPWEPTYRQSEASVLENVASNEGLRDTPQSRELWEQGVAAMRAAADLQPENPYVLERFADYLGRARAGGAPDGDDLRREQRAALQRAIELHPHRGELFAKLAEVLREAGRAREALGVAERGRAVQPGNVSVLRALARAADEVGPPFEAFKAWRRLSLVTTDDEIQGKLAQYLSDHPEFREFTDNPVFEDEDRAERRP